MKSRKAALLLLCAVVLAQSGCSFLASSTQAVAITASEPEAVIYADGVEVGRGTATAQLDCDRPHVIAAKVGDRQGTVTIGTRVSGLGVLDIVLGFFTLVNWIGIAAPGFRTLDRDCVTVKIPAK